MRKSRDFEKSVIFSNDVIFGKKTREFENRVNLKNRMNLKIRMILKKIPFAAYPITPTRIDKMKLVKTLGFKDFDLAPNTIDIYYTTRNELKQYIKMFKKSLLYTL